jgi:hypothetical protein
VRDARCAMPAIANGCGRKDTCAMEEGTIDLIE